MPPFTFLSLKLGKEQARLMRLTDNQQRAEQNKSSTEGNAQGRSA
jgi:hypothetical protein